MRISRVLTFAALGVLAVLVIVAALLVALDLPAVRTALRPRLETLLSSALGLDVRIGAVDGLSLWRGARVSDVALASGDETLLEARTLYVGLGLARTLPPLVDVRVEGTGVAAHLRRTADGTLNLVDAFTSKEVEEDEPPPAWLGAVSIALRGGRATLTGVAEAPLELGAIDSDVVLRLGEPGRLTIERLDARFGAASELAARGALDLGAPSGVELLLEAKRLAGSDLAPLVPSVRPEAELRGTVEVAGTLDAPAAEVHLAAGGARLDVWASLAEEAAGRRVEASWQAIDVDPAKLVLDAAEALLSGAGYVNAVVGEGWPSELQADARLWAASVGAARVEWLTAQARREDERILLDLQLAAPGDAAAARVHSWVAVAEPHPAGLEADFAVTRPGLLPEPVPGALGDSDLRGRLVASATRLTGEERALSAELQLERGRLRGVALDGVTLRARLEHGVVSVEELRVAGGATRLTAWGWAEVEGDPATRDLRVELTGPVDLALLPGARGTAHASATVWGTMAAVDATVALRSDGRVVLPGAAGTVRVEARAADVGSAEASAEVDLDAALEPGLDLVDLVGEGPHDLDLALAWRRARAGEPALVAHAVAREGEAPDRVELELSATAPDARRHRIAALVERRGETIAVRLDELRVTPPDGPPWTLARPATVSWAPERITASDVVLGSRAGRVTVDGELVRAGRNDLSLQISDLDLATVCELAGLAEPCGGELEASLRLAGTSAAPDVSGRVRASGLALSGQEYGDADLSLETERRLVVQGSLGRAPLGPLEIAARVPLAGGWPLPTVPRDRPFDATLTGTAIELAGLRAFAEDALSDLAGRADLDVAARGTLAEPELSGSLSASGIRLGLVATSTTWTEGTLRMSFVGNAVTVDELSFRDRDDGRVSGSGEISLAGEESGFDVRITLDSLLVAERPEASAEASGAIAITGGLAQPTMEGNIHIDRATIKPALVPGGSGLPEDETIRVSYSGTPPYGDPQTIGDVPELLPPEPPGEAPAEPVEQESLLYRRGAMNVTVTLGDPVVVERSDAYIRLGGQLYVTKKPEDPVRVSGEISSDRGWYLFRGRRIVLESAYVSFSGEVPIDPYLTIEARYNAPEHVITVRIQGTIKNPELDLSSDPPLDQSDILAVLLFGKTVSQLSGGQGSDLRQEAIGLLASYVAPELEQSLMETFGLASLTFQLPTGSSYGSVGIGRYFGDDIFVSIGQTFGGPEGGTARQLGGPAGSSVTVQYYLTPSITLQTSSSTEGESAIDAVWHRRY